MSARPLLGLCLVLLCIAGLAQPPEDAPVVRVSYVVDGDTVVLAGPRTSVRYLGINAPEEGQPLYYAAKAANRDLVWRRDVYLEFGRERYDAYGRLLAYLWVERDGRWVLVNEELLRRGLAQLLVLWPKEDQHYERLRRAQTLAQVEKLGLWSIFPDPLSLATVEESVLKFLLQAVTVVFTVDRIEEGKDAWTLWGAHSRYGFHVVVMAGVWNALGLCPPDLKGQTVAVTGQLEWTRLEAGPRILVLYPEQWSERPDLNR